MRYQVDYHVFSRNNRAVCSCKLWKYRKKLILVITVRDLFDYRYQEVDQQWFRQMGLFF